MNTRSGSMIISLFVSLSVLLFLARTPSADASTAYGTLNNFDCVNDTGVEAHGFDIELDDVRSKDITYTYDYNHYGVPKITEDTSSVPGHTNVLVRYAAVKTAGGWSAYTAIPTNPIAPTQGHQFTNPSVNFGGEHFGVGYYGAPTAVKYNWLIDNGTGTLIHGPPVYVATPTFVYNPPVAAAPAFVQAAIVPPPPPVLPPKRFGEATWVKEIKTSTHNTNKVELVDLVDPDPDNAAAQNWANGEPAVVEVEWKLLQTEFANTNNAKGFLQGANENLPGGDEIITRRYEFYKYTGPLDAETGEAMADAVAANGTNGVGSVTYADYFDFVLSEWHIVTVDTATLVIVGDFIGAQMSGFDVAPKLGLIDHIPDGELGVAYAERTVVVPGTNTPFHATTTGTLPDGTTLGEFTGIFKGTPTVAGAFTFTVDARELLTDAVITSKTYTVTIPGGVLDTGTIATSASPPAGGSTTGDGVYNNGVPVTVVATHNAGYVFVNWTENNQPVSVTAVYPFTVNGNRTLVAHFNQPPIALCRNVTKPAGAHCTAAVTAAEADNGSSDPDGTIVSQTLNPAGPFSKGTTPVTMTVTDDQGATSTCNFTVTVNDTEKPQISCPSNIVVTAAFGQTAVAVTFPAPAVSDNCPGVVSSYTPPSGSSFPIGTTTPVSLTATDAAVNTATCTFTVTVNPPVCTIAVLRQQVLASHLKKGVRNELIHGLNEAQKKADQGKCASEKHKLQEFVRKVQHLIKKHRLFDTITGNLWIDCATSLITGLPCR